MLRFCAALIATLFMLAPASAEVASEIPLTNPEILKPPARERGALAADEKPALAPEPQINSNENTSDSTPMTLEHMFAIVQALDPQAQTRGNIIQLTIQNVPITIIASTSGNRMRAFSPFKTLDGVNGQEMYRLLQANFDSALDARYAIAKGHLISVFIHPLSELQRDQFISGLGQVVNLVLTHGTAYTSGALTFGGGDSNKLHQRLIEDLLKKGDKI